MFELIDLKISILLNMFNKKNVELVIRCNPKTIINNVNNVHHQIKGLESYNSFIHKYMEELKNGRL